MLFIFICCQTLYCTAMRNVYCLLVSWSYCSHLYAYVYTYSMCIVKNTKNVKNPWGFNIWLWWNVFHVGRKHDLCYIWTGTRLVWAEEKTICSLWNRLPASLLIVHLLAVIKSKIHKKNQQSSAKSDLTDHSTQLFLACLQSSQPWRVSQRCCWGWEDIFFFCFIFWQMDKLQSPKVNTKLRTSHSSMNTALLNDHNVFAKAHVLEHACWLIQHAVEVWESVITVRWGWHASLCWFWAQRFKTWHWIKEKRAGETKKEKVTGQEWKRLVTLHKLGCGEAEQPLGMYCTQSVLGPVGGLLCMLLLRWLLGRENLVLETENRKWSTTSLMSQNIWKKNNFCLRPFI